jgi:hypothetical protein
MVAGAPGARLVHPTLSSIGSGFLQLYCYTEFDAHAAGASKFLRVDSRYEGQDPAVLPRGVSWTSSRNSWKLQLPSPLGDLVVEFRAAGTSAADKNRALQKVLHRRTKITGVLVTETMMYEALPVNVQRVPENRRMANYQFIATNRRDDNGKRVRSAHASVEAATNAASRGGKRPRRG